MIYRSKASKKCIIRNTEKKLDTIKYSRVHVCVCMYNVYQTVIDSISLRTISCVEINQLTTGQRFS